MFGLRSLFPTTSISDFAVKYSVKYYNKLMGAEKTFIDDLIPISRMDENL